MKKVTIKVPATSANMGPGFDNLGIALTLYNTFEVTETDSGLVIEGGPEEFRNEQNLVYISMLRCFSKINYDYKGFHIKITADIPVCSGLGSSSSCVIGGIMAANELAGSPLRKQELVDLATQIEGHPDNVAPALLGNMVIAVQENEKVYFNRLQIATGLRFIALTPNFGLPTEKARSVLPKTIPFQDAVFNIGRTGLLISSLVTGSFHNLKPACHDRLHQSYRKHLVNEWDEVFAIAESIHASAVFLSGAGPTIMLILEDTDHDIVPELQQKIKQLTHKWTLRQLRIEWHGARVL
jgi:homoserine kinase